MFSHYELEVIETWAAVGLDILEGHMECSIYTEAEKQDKQREYEALGSIIGQVTSLQAEFTQLDADHVIHLLEVCARYQEHIKEQVDKAEIATEDYGSEMYQIGYMQGRAELGLLTSGDVAVIEQWEEELDQK